MVSPGKFTHVRARGPELLARWARHPSGYWRLSVYRRDWREEDSVYTDIPSGEPRPGDQYLAKIRFVPAGDGWTEVDGGWEQAVGRASEGISGFGHP